jgi:hypothetical protein
MTVDREMSFIKPTLMPSSEMQRLEAPRSRAEPTATWRASSNAAYASRWQNTAHRREEMRHGRRPGGRRPARHKQRSSPGGTPVRTQGWMRKVVLYCKPLRNAGFTTYRSSKPCIRRSASSLRMSYSRSYTKIGFWSRPGIPKKPYHSKSPMV